MVAASSRSSLHKSPFWLLGASSRDSRQRIVELADEKLLELDHDVCQSARSALTSPRTRLAVEVAWLPGVSPRKASELVEAILKQPTLSTSGIPVLAGLNLSVASFEALRGEEPASLVADLIRNIAAQVDDVSVGDVRRDIDEDRAVSGFPKIGTDEQVETELANRKREIRDCLKNTLNRFPTETVIEVVTQVVEETTNGGERHAPELIDDLVDAYEVAAHEFLTKEASNISQLVEAARTGAQSNHGEIWRLLEAIERVARNWDRVAQPIQVSTMARGMIHQPSSDLAFEIRGLAITLVNENDMVSEARRLNELLQDVFAEVPVVLERTGEDAEAIDALLENREEWTRNISYRAEIGAVFKKTLSISPQGVSWQGKTYPLAEITRVRWGGVKQSVNGIPAGTAYTLAFGDSRSEGVVSLRSEVVYSAFLEKLWKAVGGRLVVELVTALGNGESLRFNDAEIEDEGILLKKQSWMGGGERIRCAWSEVQTWSADGKFYIGARHDEKFHVVLSYIEVPNVHILEQALRIGFKQGASRLSGILRND